MKRVWIVVLAAVIVYVMGLPGCARDQELVSIRVQPTTATFLSPDPGLQIQFSATGTYIHPPETKDITGQVTWKTDVAQLITVSGGLVTTTGVGCGIADISATLGKGTMSSQNVAIGYATVTVEDPNDPVCPGGSDNQSTLIVTPDGTGSGVITSAPGGISCPGIACGFLFDNGTTITLTATPNAGSSFGSWADCPSASGNICTVVLDGNINVRAIFN